MKAISVADIMRMGSLLGGVLLAVSLALPSGAYADQAQDWVLSGSRPEGASAILDVFLGGVQGAVEHRTKIYGGANMLTLRGSSILALPFASGKADVELRILNIILGVSVGGIDSWREMVFEKDEPVHRKQRRYREASGDFERKQHLFYEGRGMIAFPLNEYVLAVSGIRYRVDGISDRTLDRIGGTANVRDDGMFEWNSMLFFKHKHFGAIAPTFTRHIYERGGQEVDQFTFGLTFLSRASLVRRNDLILVQLNLHHENWTGGDDEGDNFGDPMYRGPLTFFVAYRTVIDFFNPALEDDDDDDHGATSAANADEDGAANEDGELE